MTKKILKPQITLLAVCLCLFSELPTAASTARFVISEDGEEVTDNSTGLIWRHCAEGFSWNGVTCAGTNIRLTLKAALQLADTEGKIDINKVWRLPNVKELSSLADRTRDTPSIDTKTFPATPANSFWSSTPYIAQHNSAYTVGFQRGNISNFDGAMILSVRLVRAGRE